MIVLFRLSVSSILPCLLLFSQESLVEILCPRLDFGKTLLLFLLVLITSISVKTSFFCNLSTSKCLLLSTLYHKYFPFTSSDTNFTTRVWLWVWSSKSCSQRKIFFSSCYLLGVTSACSWMAANMLLLRVTTIFYYNKVFRSLLEESECESDSEQLLLVLSDLHFLLLVVWIHWPFLVIWITVLLTSSIVEGFVTKKWNLYCLDPSSLMKASTLLSSLGSNLLLSSLIKLSFCFCRIAESGLSSLSTWALAYLIAMSLLTTVSSFLRYL